MPKHNQPLKKCLFCDKPQADINYLFCEDCQHVWTNKLNNVFSTNDGQDILHVLMYISDFYETTFTGNAHSSFKSGRKEIVTWLYKQVYKAKPSNAHKAEDLLMGIKK